MLIEKTGFYLTRDGELIYAVGKLPESSEYDWLVVDKCNDAYSCMTDGRFWNPNTFSQTDESDIVRHLPTVKSWDDPIPPEEPPPFEMSEGWHLLADGSVLEFRRDGSKFAAIASHYLAARGFLKGERRYWENDGTVRGLMTTDWEDRLRVIRKCDPPPDLPGHLQHMDPPQFRTIQHGEISHDGWIVQRKPVAPGFYTEWLSVSKDCGRAWSGWTAGGVRPAFAVLQLRTVEVPPS